MSQLEVDKIVPQSGTTLTIGDSGDTINFADGQNINIDSNTLYIDSTNNRVGIGTSSPSYELQVQDTGGSCFIAITSNNTNESTILLGDSDSASIGRVTYRNSDNSLAFNTNGSEHMRIDSSGFVFVGQTSRQYNEEGVSLNPSGYSHFTSSGGYPILLNRKTNDGEIIRLYRDTTQVGNIGANSSSLYIAGTSKGFRFTASQLKPCNTSGANDDGNYDLGSSSTRFKDLYLGGGLYVGGTGTANKLDDYEEGDWTPTVGGNATYSVQRGRYYKIGNIVVALYQIQIGVLGTGNNEKISGLPFTSENDTNLNVRSGYVSYFANLAVSVGSIATYVENNGTSFYFVSTTGDQVTCNNAPNVLGNSAHIYGTVIYNTA